MEAVSYIYSKWCKIPDKIRFVLVGGVNAAISYVIFAVGLYLLGEAHYQACVILQWSLSSVFSYFNQKFFVFCTRGNYIHEYLTWAISYVLNVIILELLIKFAIKNVYLSQFISIFLVSVVTYVLFKYFAFKVTK